MKQATSRAGSNPPTPVLTPAVPAVFPALTAVSEPVSNSADSVASSRPSSRAGSDHEEAMAVEQIVSDGRYPMLHASSPTDPFSLASAGASGVVMLICNCGL
jgi:hypothetical protein